MDYDSLLQDRWDRLMLRISENQLDESIGSSLPDVSRSFDSDIQFELELENSENTEDENVVQSESSTSDNQVEIESNKTSDTEATTNEENHLHPNETQPEVK